MPRQPKAKTDTSPEKESGTWQQFEFLNYELPKEEKEALKKMPLWNGEWDKLLDTATRTGFAISLKVDGFNKCYAAYMQIRLRSHPCFGYILTGRGSTQLKALRQVLYKHFVSLHEDWGEVPAPEASTYDD